jgi:hypothetical protein
MHNETDKEKEQQQVPPKDPVEPGENLVAPPEPPKPEKPITDKETTEYLPKEPHVSQSNSDQVAPPEPSTNEGSTPLKDKREDIFSRDAKKLASLAENIDSTIKSIINSCPGLVETTKKITRNR